MSEPVDYIARTSEEYTRLGYDAYRWFRAEDDPAVAPMRRPLHEQRIGLIASGGIYRHGQVAFHWKDDTSFRRIRSDTATEDLRATHFAYDVEPARADPNVVFPIDTLRSLRDEGEIGGLAEEFFTFMGGIYSTRRVREELIPSLLDAVAASDIDLALLVPV